VLHLALELLHPRLDLGRLGELLGREDGADLEGDLGAVLQELLPQLADLLQLRLEIGGLNGGGGEQLVGQLILSAPQLFEGARTGSCAPWSPAPA